MATATRSPPTPARPARTGQPADQVGDRHLGGGRRAAAGHPADHCHRLRRIRVSFAEGTKAAVGALLAAMNTASEYGFGGVIAALPGFLSVSEALRSVPNRW
jgi:hypothetical protein